MENYQSDLASAWTELTGYVQQAQLDGKPINADDLMQYMTELKRRAVKRAWDRLGMGELPYA